MVHIAQTVMALGGTIDYLIEAVFNHPTLSEPYKVAALDAGNKLNTLSRVEEA
jgi:NAD(P) transhydrogenase